MKQITVSFALLRIIRLLLQREPNLDKGSSDGTAGQDNLTAHSVYNVLYNGQPKTGAAYRTAPPFVHSVEPLKHSGLLV
jgi:hypothetical protein